MSILLLHVVISSEEDMSVGDLCGKKRLKSDRNLLECVCVFWGGSRMSSSESLSRALYLLYIGGGAA